MPRFLGVDLGSRRIGIAISDDKGKVATPYLTMPRTNDQADAQAVAEIASGEGCKQVVVGLPLQLDGTRGEAAFVTEAFAAKLKDAGAKVKFWDERLTTAEADKKLKKAGVKGKKRRTVVDKTAAMGILQSFLDSKK
jgi:putative Holliday junction resolvase